MTSSTAEWSLHMALGGKPKVLGASSLSASILSQDGKHSIVILSHQIRVYYISTRQCVRVIEYDLKDLVDVRLDGENGSHLLLFRDSGEVITMNWKDRNSVPVISTGQIETEFPILSVLAIRRRWFYLVVGKTNKRNTLSPHSRHVLLVNRDDFTSSIIFSVENVIKYATSLDSNIMAFLKSENEVCLANFGEILASNDNSSEEPVSFAVENDQETIAFPYKSPVTSIAVSNDFMVALGTSSGAIQVLYGGLLAEKPQRLLKWHIDQVRALQFSYDGKYLLSGGLEKVLVFWQLDTDKTQFLPRLNGTIDKISLDKNKSEYYTLLLRVAGSSADANEDESNHEILILSAVDLVSRLSVNSIRPKIDSNIKQTLLKAKKKAEKQGTGFDFSKLKHNYTSTFEVHPKSKNLYFPYDAAIQAYDIVKGEQSFVQNAAQVLTTGKVRSENKLLDPIVSLLSFTNDGEWMCTFDTVNTSAVDNLLSKDDSQYALKFWKFIDSTSKASATANGANNRVGHWELCSKIINPHGNTNPVMAVKPAPSLYHQGLAFLTADNKGGLRIWRPRIPKEIYQNIKQSNTKAQQTAWTLRKTRPCGAQTSDAVDVCWSEDGSLIIMGYECTLLAINSQSLEEIPKETFVIPALSGSRIRSVSIMDNYLIVLSKTSIISYDLLTAKTTSLIAKVNTTHGAKNLIAVDTHNKVICSAVNYYDNEANNFKLKSKMILFKPNELQPVFVGTHTEGISSIRHFESSFLFVDLDSRLGLLSPKTTIIDSQKENDHDLATKMNHILLQAQSNAESLENQTATVKATSNKKQGFEEVDGNAELTKAIDSHTFQHAFQNIEGVGLETVFDRIIKIIK